MAKVVVCPGCESKLRVEDSRDTLRIRCPRCETLLSIGGSSRSSSSSSSRPASPPRRSSKPAASDDEFLDELAPPVRRPARERSSRSRSNAAGGLPGWAVGAGAGVGGTVIVVLLVLLLTGGRNSHPTPAPEAFGNSNLQAANAAAPVDGTKPAGGANSHLPPGQQGQNPATAGNPAATGTGAGTLGPGGNPLATVAHGDAADAKSRGPAVELSREDLIDRAKKGVVLITCFDAFGTESSLGTGFIIDAPQGIVVTNYHVVNEAAKAVATFDNEEKVDFQGYLAWDKKADLVLLKLQRVPSYAASLPLGPEKDPRSGSEVVAIGHPAGFRFSSTYGSVNAVHLTRQLPQFTRDFLEAPDEMAWVQTDATIFGGNSGGPLLNKSGEVIGVNTFIHKEAKLAFASHIKHVRQLEKQKKPEIVKFTDPQISSDPFIALFGELDPDVSTLLAEYRKNLEKLDEEMEAQEKQPSRRTGPPASITQEFQKIINRLTSLVETRRGTRTAYQASFFVAKIAPRHMEHCQHIVRAVTREVSDSHISEKSLGMLALEMSQFSESLVADFLRKIIDASPHRDVKGQACFALAVNLSSGTALRPGLPAGLRRPGQFPGQPDSPGIDPKKKEEALALLNRVIKEFGDVKLGPRSLREIAEIFTQLISQVNVGDICPSFSGPDGEGKKYDLAEHKGKVILLVFWSQKSPIIQELIGLQTRLLEENRGKAFAIAGVNVDPVPEFQALTRQRKLPWRSLADGQEGSVQRQMGVDEVPTGFLVDHRGTVRYKWEGIPDPDELRKVIKLLVVEAVKKPGSTPTTPRPGTPTTPRPGTIPPQRPGFNNPGRPQFRPN